MESGLPFFFRVSIWNGLSFSLSSRGAHPPMNRNVPTREVRRKTPSMRRRDQRRWEEFQAKKSSDTPVTGHQPPATGSRPETHSSGSSPQRKVSEHLQTQTPQPPMKPAPKPEKPNLESGSFPPPAKTEVDTSDTKDILLTFCAPDLKTAKILSQKNFSKSKFMPHRSSTFEEPNHFIFLIKMNSQDRNLLERDASKLNNSVNLIEITEKDRFGRLVTMECGQKHCQECPNKN